MGTSSQSQRRTRHAFQLRNTVLGLSQQDSINKMCEVKKMSREVGVSWKIKVKIGDKEIEVVGVTPEYTYKWFKELEKTYLAYK